MPLHPVTKPRIRTDMNVPIVLAANEAYFPGLYVTIGGVLLNASPEATFRFTVMDGGITDASWSRLEELVMRINNKSELSRLTIDGSAFDGLRTDFGNSHMTYVRLLMPEVIPESKVLYIDCDVVILRPMDALFQTDLSGRCIAAVRDAGMQYLRRDCPTFGSLGISDDTPYFNAGIILVNLDAWRELEVQRRAIEYLREHGDHCTWWDQTVLNALLWDRVCYVEEEWNQQSYSLPDDFGIHTHNIHFVGPVKPFRDYTPGYAGRLWYSLAEALGYPPLEPLYACRRRQVFECLRTLDRIGILGPLYRLISPLWSKERRMFFPYPLWNSTFESLLDRYRQNWQTRG